MDLFDHAVEKDTADKPLAERLRPHRLDDFVGQEHVLGPGRALRRAIEADQVPSLILWGPPGTGKTTIARIMAERTGAVFVSFSAVMGGVKEIREIVAGGPRPAPPAPAAHHPVRRRDPPLHQGAAGRVPAARGGRGGDAHRRHHREPLLRDQRRPPLALPGGDPARAHRGGDCWPGGPGAGGARGPRRGPHRSAGARELFARFAFGDARRALNALEVAAAAARLAGRREILPADAEEALQHKALLYDKAGEEHYNVISAFIKSLRGSDPDAAVYYMVRMLEAGEDPRFVLRRMVIFASEDVGNADPRALAVAVDALQAVELVGLPEGVLPMTQAAIYLAMAPKSNAALTAYGAARKLVKERGALPVPLSSATRPRS